MIEKRRPRGFWLQCTGLIVLVLIAFAPALFNGYVWDDVLLTANENIRTASGLWRCWFDPTANRDFYPMTYTSWWIEYRLWGLEPAGYHLVNVLMHGANAGLLFAILRMLGVRWAWLIAAVFAVHPVQVESVAWVAERKNTLSGLFYFLAAWCFLRFWMRREGIGGTEGAGNQRARPQAMEQRAWWWYGAALLFHLCAMLAKPLVMTLAAGIVIVMWWKRGGRLLWRDVVLALPFFALAVPMAALTTWVQKHYVGAEGNEYALGLAERVLVAGRALCFYVGKAMLPYQLSFAYPRWNIDASLWWQWLFPAAAVGAMAAAWLARRRVGVGLFAAGAFFIVTLSPALGFFNVYWHRYYFVADHMQYLAVIAVAAIVVGGAGDAVVRRAGAAAGRMVGVAGAAVLLVFVVCSFKQSTAYRDAETLWIDTLAKHEDAWIAHNNLGWLLTQQRRTSEALPHFQRALELAPLAPDVFKNAIVAMKTFGLFDEAAAAAERRLRFLPDDPVALATEGEALALAGRHAEAEASYRRAVERITARLDRGGFAWAELPEAQLRLGQSLLGLGRFDEAAARLRESIESRRALEAASGVVEQGKAGETRYRLALALLCSEKVKQAAAELRGLVEMESSLPSGDNAEHLARFALVASAAREGGVDDLPSARWAAERACELSGGRSPRYLEVLAIVLSAQGDARGAALIKVAERLANEVHFTAIAQQISGTRDAIERGERPRMTGAELAAL